MAKELFSLQNQEKKAFTGSSTLVFQLSSFNPLIYSSISTSNEADYDILFLLCSEPVLDL